MAAFAILDLLEKITIKPGTTDVTLKSTGTVAVSTNQTLSVTKIAALGECWADTIREMLPDRPVERIDGFVTVVRDPKGRRYRVTITRNHEGEALSVRPLPEAILSPEELRLPDGLKEYFINLPGGLFLVGGVTGSGKSWTLASLVQARAQEVGGKIVTIERPIEFLHQDTDKAIFQQREVGKTTSGYARALQDALNENPRVIMVQELRRADEAETALSAALSGHVVAASIHAYTATTAPQRFLSIINPTMEDLGARDALASCLEGIVMQRLMAGTDGLVPVFEVLLFRGRDGKRLNQMERLVRSGNWVGLRQEMEVRKRDGMLMWENSIAERKAAGLIPE